MRVGLAKFANLAIKLVATATSLERSQMNECLIKPSHRSTDAENLVKIGSAVSEITDEKLITKSMKNKEKTSREHIT